MKNNNKISNCSSWLMFSICIGLLIIMFSPKMHSPILGIITGFIVVLTSVFAFKRMGKAERYIKKISEKND